MERRDNVFGVIDLAVLFIGLSLVSLFLFWIPVLGFLGLSFVIFGVGGIIVMRRRISALKKTNPERYEALRAESKRKSQEMRAREVKLSDFPRWLIVLFTFAFLIAVVGQFGFFASNPFLDVVIGVSLLVFIVYYNLYERKIRRRKKEALSNSQNATTL